jgi:hypothetical protein
MKECEKERAISCMKLAIELAGDGGMTPFTDVEYNLVNQLLDELEKQESLKYTDNSIRYISENDTYDFFAGEYDEYAKVIGKCFFNKELEVAVKILLVPDEDDYNLNTYEFIYEQFENNAFGWEPEDYIWLQEQTDEMYTQYKITPYANINNASENMFHVGKNGNLYTSVDCGNDWYEFTEISNEEFEKIRKEAIENINQ